MLIRTLSTATLVAGLAAAPAGAAVLGFTGATFDPAPAGAITSTTLLDSFTTSAGSVTTLAAAASALAPAPAPGQEIKNYWGTGGTEIEGAAAIANLDVSTGLVSIGTDGLAPVDALFGVGLAGAAGDGNDIFITEIGKPTSNSDSARGNDNIVLLPLDAAGNPIGDYELAINASVWGDSGADLTSAVEYNNAGQQSVVNTFDIVGLAFDVTDFTSGTNASPLAVVWGVRFLGDPAGVDPSIVGYNTAAIPEPASLALLGLGGLAMLRRDRA